MKKNDGDLYEDLYNKIEELKNTANNSVLNILDFCQSCISDSTLEYLPSSIDIVHDNVIFNYEEDNGDHLMVSFGVECQTFETSSINVYSFQNNSIKSNLNLNWIQASKSINTWARKESIG